MRPKATILNTNSVSSDELILKADNRDEFLTRAKRGLVGIVWAGRASAYSPRKIVPALEQRTGTH